MNAETIDKARANIQKIVNEIIEKKEQKTHSLRPSSFLVECSGCKQKVKKAFTGYDVKKKKFVCYDCLIKEL